MKNEDLILKREYSYLEVNSIGANQLNQCLELDILALNGLWTKSQWKKELTDRHRKCFGIQLGSKIIAFASGWIVLDELQITAIAVDPKKRRLGLGEKTLDYLLLQAKNYGVQKAILEVKSYNFAAKNLYLKIGFKLKGIRKNFYKDGSDALVYTCDLRRKEFPQK